MGRRGRQFSFLDEMTMILMAVERFVERGSNDTITREGKIS